MIMLFAGFTVLMIPIFVMYFNGGQYNDPQNMDEIGRWTLGNLGQGHTVCYHRYLDFSGTVSI